ncbi:hypothetical protein ACFL1I_01215 [Candidatus Omnitrophota bacterium]
MRTSLLCAALLLFSLAAFADADSEIREEVQQLQEHKLAIEQTRISQPEIKNLKPTITYSLREPKTDYSFSQATFAVRQPKTKTFEDLKTSYTLRRIKNKGISQLEYRYLMPRSPFVYGDRNAASLISE